MNERLQQVSASLPQGITPVLSPPATAFGELYQYTLEGNLSSMELKDIQEWQVKNQLRTIPGVSDINTWGGESKQFQVKVDPQRLAQYGLTLHDVAIRIEENNKNFGGGYIEHASEQYTVRGSGRATTPQDLGNIVLMANQGHTGAAQGCSRCRDWRGSSKRSCASQRRNHFRHGDHAQRGERKECDRSGQEEDCVDALARRESSWCRSTIRHS